MNTPLRKLFPALLLSVFLPWTGSTQNPGAAQPKQPIAVVGGQAIYEDDLLPSIQGELRTLKNQEYELKSKALEDLVNQKLLEAEAKKRGISPEKLLEQEADSKVSDPTDAEVEAFYLSQRNRGNRPPEVAKAQLREDLKQAKLQQARQEYFKRLREKAEVTILLRPPRIEVGYDSARLHGNPSAPVIIVEFSDFQCPFCRRAHATLNELLAKYNGQVSLAYRDFPLREIHPQAESAAEASRCAGEQGKFWEYHDLLFSSAKLDRDALLEYARSLKLDAKQFDSCLASSKYADKVEHDLQDGEQAGVAGTPGFFINGIAFSGARPAAAFEKIIDAELAARKLQGSTPAKP